MWPRFYSIGYLEGSFACPWHQQWYQQQGRLGGTDNRTNDDDDKVKGNQGQEDWYPKGRGDLSLACKHASILYVALPHIPFALGIRR